MRCHGLEPEYPLRLVYRSRDSRQAVLEGGVSRVVLSLWAWHWEGSWDPGLFLSPSLAVEQPRGKQLCLVRHTRRTVGTRATGLIDHESKPPYIWAKTNSSSCYAPYLPISNNNGKPTLVIQYMCDPKLGATSCFIHKIRVTVVGDRRWLSNWRMSAVSSRPDDQSVWAKNPHQCQWVS